MSTIKEFYTVRDLAIFLGLSEDSIRSRIKRKQIKAKKLGRRILIPRSEVERLIGSLKDWGDAKSKGT